MREYVASILTARRVYLYSIALALLLWFSHVVSLPVRISYDGLGYIDAADVLFSKRFPQDWPSNRTPLYPFALKVSFFLLGRQPAAAILVSSLAALGASLLLGEVTRRLAGELAAAAVVVGLTAYPTLIAYEHSVLTEAGTCFFLSALLYLLVLKPRTTVAAMWTTVGIVAVLAVGSYWRTNVMVLAPVAAGCHLWWEKRLRPWRIASPQAALILILPVVICMPWNRYTDNAGLRDVTLKQGMLRQALLPPEHPVIRRYMEPYFGGIRDSIHDRNFYSGLRWTYISLLVDKIPSRPLGLSIPAFYWSLVRQYPGRYFQGLGRTFIFFAGVDGAESDNRIGREEVLTPGSKISDGPQPLRELIRQQFQQPPAPSVAMYVLRRISVVYDFWTIIACALLPLSLVFALWRRDLDLLVLTLIPLVYATSYACLLVSLDRFVVPAYPIALAASIITPIVVSRQFHAER